MASAPTQTETLVAATVTTFVAFSSAYSHALVARVDATNTDPVWISTTGEAPVVDADEWYCLPGGVQSRVVPLRQGGSATIALKVISAGVPKIYVEAFDARTYR